MKEYQNYIFDLDGTLLNTLQDLTASTNYALRTWNMPEHSVDDIRRFVGNGVKLLMQRAVPNGLDNPHFEEAYRTFREHYLEHSLDTTQPYPGIMQMLGTLKESGKGIAVVSNKFNAATQDLCHHFFGDYVTVAVGEREGIRKKPAPDTVIEAMRQMEAMVKNSVYIGDSDVDVAVARNSGLPCISVLWGFRDKEFLMENGATVFVEKPEEVVVW
ncbi:MAG: HAD family hydrolase [Prevotellaceae bacterium]|nr:HAD family hydrolase [Prevotella sp.]MDD7257572.1 HAD family hydrolase [Prevotellaceae bacterium]MDY6130953.1 HAD family hydrolase [Prevotella sp.]